jgi:hypothetical protein
MRLKAKEGQGHPVVAGMTIEPRRGGIYEVDAAVGKELVESHGYIDVDAPPKAKAPVAAVASDELRGAVVAMLKEFGVVVADPNDKVLADALGRLPASQSEQVVAAVKAAETSTEERVRAELKLKA